MTKETDIQFAPLWIPIVRRRQTLTVFLWLAAFFFFGPVMLFAMFYWFFFYTNVYYVPLLYAVYYVIDRETPETGDRP